MTLSRLLCLLALSVLSTMVAAQTCPVGNPRVAPNDRYTATEPVLGQRVVTDSATGLMWKGCSEGQSGSACTGSATTHTWTEALALASVAMHAGFGDWRLPNREELRTLVETGCHSPSINTVAFPVALADSYWSATTNASNVSSVWLVSFADGELSTNSKRSDQRVRLVRGGQGLDAFDSGEFLLRDGFE